MRSNTFRLRQLLLRSVVMAATLFSWHCNAQDPNHSVTKDVVDRWRLVIEEISSSFRVSRNGEPISNLSKLTLVNLWDPVASARLGQIYLWTQDGRPVIAGSIMTGNALGIRDAVNIVYEFNSLDSQAIQVEKDKVLLDCPTAGIEWHRLESNVAPSQNRANRLIAMRNIARSFQVDGTNQLNQQRKFDLLPTPIYRYEKELSSATDGAMFAVGDATNPYVFILIEARDDNWWVAVARSSTWALRIHRNNQLFFNFDLLPRESQRLSGPYYIDFMGERRSNSSPEIQLPMSKR